jgi:hypothetical protein
VSKFFTSFPFSEVGFFFTSGTGRSPAGGEGGELYLLSEYCNKKYISEKLLQMIPFFSLPKRMTEEEEEDRVTRTTTRITITMMTTKTTPRTIPTIAPSNKRVCLVF